jgi:hypothetical protein
MPRFRKNPLFSFAMNPDDLGGLPAPAQQWFMRI